MHELGLPNNKDLRHALSGADYYDPRRKASYRDQLRWEAIFRKCGWPEKVMDAGFVGMLRNAQWHYMKMYVR